MKSESIKDFYAGDTEYEWKRLIKDSFHRLELDTTLFFLKKYLPKNGLILDAGGGPGRYTIELAKMGYRVTLFDLTPELLEKAKKMIARSGVRGNVESVIEGSITDLSCFEDGVFDAVLCLGGPLSHVQNAADRAQAINELARVAKKEAPIFISVMGRLGVMIKMLRYWVDELELTDHFRNLWQEGEDTMWRHEYYCHFFLPEEFEKLIESNGLEIVERAGLQGLAHYKEDTNKVSKGMPKAWQNWLESHSKLCIHPAVFATSDHMLIVAKKSSSVAND